MATTWGDFVTRVKDTCKSSPAQPFIKVDGTEDAKLKTFLQEQCSRFSRMTKVLYADNTDIITTGGAGTTGWLYGPEPVYDLMDEAFYNFDQFNYKLRVFLPTNVVVGDRVLRNLQGRYGPVSIQEMESLDPYGTAKATSVADIVYWCRIPHRKIRIFPCPATTFNDSGVITGVIPGYYLHPNLTNDLHNLYFADDHVFTAALFCAAELLFPWSDQSSAEKVGRLDQRAGDQMSEMIEKSEEIERELVGTSGDAR